MPKRYSFFSVQKVRLGLRWLYSFKLYFSYDLVGPVGLWIAGGYNGHNDSTTVEFIAVNNSDNQLVPYLPKSISWSPSMFMHNETIMICGGIDNFKTCLKLQEGSWTEYNSMRVRRDFAAVVSTITATFIFGGSRGKDTYEYLEKNAPEWKLGKIKIPGGLRSGCSIAISGDEIWLIGGRGRHTGKRILSFDMKNQTFTELLIKLKHGRELHQCAFIPETRNILVTGGIEVLDGDYQYLDSTEIIDVKSINVTEGPPMKFKRSGHGIGVLNIEGKERIVVYGGRDSQFSLLKSVEFYDAKMKQWKPTNIELSEAKDEFGFMTIKSQP